MPRTASGARLPVAARCVASSGRAATLWQGAAVIDSLSISLPGESGYEVCSSGGSTTSMWV